MCSEVAWLAARQQDSAEAYSAFARNWPEHRQTAEARARADLRSREAASESGTLAAYQQYLAEYTAGAYASRAQARIDDLSWAAAEAEQTAAAVEGYLAGLPEGRHAATASRTLEAVRWRDAFESGAVEPLLAYVAAHRDERIAYTPRQPRIVAARYPNGIPLMALGSESASRGQDGVLQLVQVAVRGEFRADRLEGTIQPVFPGLPDCEGPAVPFSAVAQAE